MQGEGEWGLGGWGVGEQQHCTLKIHVGCRFMADSVGLLHAILSLFFYFNFGWVMVLQLGGKKTKNKRREYQICSRVVGIR